MPGNRADFVRYLAGPSDSSSGFVVTLDDTELSMTKKTVTVFRSKGHPWHVSGVDCEEGLERLEGLVENS